MFQKLRLKLNKVQQKQKIKTEGSEHHVTLILRFTHGLLHVLYMVCMYIWYIIYKEVVVCQICISSLWEKYSFFKGGKKMHIEKIL